MRTVTTGTSYGVCVDRGVVMFDHFTSAVKYWLNVRRVRNSRTLQSCPNRTSDDSPGIVVAQGECFGCMLTPREVLGIMKWCGYGVRTANAELVVPPAVDEYEILDLTWICALHHYDPPILFPEYET